MICGEEAFHTAIRLTDADATQQFSNAMNACDTNSSNHISVSDMIAALRQQKNGNNAGSNGLTMESLVFIAVKLSTRLRLLFNIQRGPKSIKPP